MLISQKLIGSWLSLLTVGWPNVNNGSYSLAACKQHSVYKRAVWTAGYGTEMNINGGVLVALLAGLATGELYKGSGQRFRNSRAMFENLGEQSNTYGMKRAPAKGKAQLRQTASEKQMAFYPPLQKGPRHSVSEEQMAFHAPLETGSRHTRYEEQKLVKEPRMKREIPITHRSKENFEDFYYTAPYKGPGQFARDDYGLFETRAHQPVNQVDSDDSYSSSSSEDY